MTMPRPLVPTTLLFVLLTGCGQGSDRAADTEQTSAAESVPSWVDRVAAVARAIEQRPSAADSILAANDMTRAAFDSLIYEVAADPALTAAYEASRRR